MGKLETFIYVLGLSTIFFSIVSGLLYYFFFQDNMFKKTLFKIKVKGQVHNMIKELDNLHRKVKL